MRIRSLLQNPFFVREQRQSLRRGVTLTQAVGTVVITAAGALLLLAAILLPAKRGEISPAPLSVWWLLLPHLAVCAGFGFRWVHRMIVSEVERNTLEQVVLVPMTVWEWLLGKAAYPLAVIIVLWFAPLPFFLAAAMMGLVAPSALLRGFPVTMLALVSLVPGGFLVSGRSTSSARLETAGDPLERAARSVRSILITLAILVAVIAGVLEIGRPLPAASWFGIPISFGTPLVVSLLSVAIAGLVAGRALFLGQEAAWRRFLRIGYSIVAILYFTPVGIFWPLMPWWGRALAVGFGPTIAVLDYWQIRRVTGSARKSLRVPAWLQIERSIPVALSGNPFFVLELRHMSGGRPLLFALFGGVAAAAVPLFVYRQASDAGKGLPVLMQFVVLNLVIASGVVARRWEQDRKSGFFDALSLTLLSSHDLVAGRVASMAVMYGAPVVGLLLGFSALLGWYFGWRGGLPFWTTIVGLSAAATPWAAGRIHPVESDNDGFGNGSANWLLVCFSLPVSTFVFMLGFFGGMPLAALWAAAGALVAAHLLYAWSEYRCRVREMEYLRSGGEYRSTT